MPESRDRLSRQDDAIIASYSQKRISRTGDGSIGSRCMAIAFILEDDNDEGHAARTPFRWRDTSMAGSPQSIGGAIGTPIRHIAPLSSLGNSSPVVGGGYGRGRGGGVLPSWYPRRPLNDITAVVRAMERRRERGSGESLQHETPIRIYQDQDHDHKIAMFSNKHCPPSIGKVPKILLDITHHNRGYTADCLTPQKKLLNSIDTVEKVVMEELRKLKRTPSAKKAEREKRVRTLMSVR